MTTLYVADFALEVIDEAGAQFAFTPGVPTPLRHSLAEIALQRGARVADGTAAGAEADAKPAAKTK